jgi:Mg2+ and Co2+ transporter CorA
MNVPLPGQEGSPAEFWLIIFVMLAILTSVLLFFRRRGYL